MGVIDDKMDQTTESPQKILQQKMAHRVDVDSKYFLFFLVAAPPYEPEWWEPFVEILKRKGVADRPMSFLDYTVKYVPEGEDADRTRHIPIDMAGKVRSYSDYVLQRLDKSESTSSDIRDVGYIVDAFCVDQRRNLSRMETEIYKRVPERNRKGINKGLDIYRKKLRDHQKEIEMGVKEWLVLEKGHDVEVA